MINPINNSPIRPVRGIGETEKREVYAGHSLFDSSQSFLTQLIRSQKSENINKIKDILHQLTIFSKIGEESSKFGFLSTKEEKELVEKIQELRQAIEGGSLNFEYLLIELKDLLTRSINPKCSIVVHLSEIEHQSFITAENRPLPHQEEMFQSIYNQIISSLNYRSNLEINYLNKHFALLQNTLPREPSEILGLLEECK